MEIWRHAAGVPSKEVWSASVLFVVVGICSFRSSRLFGLCRPPNSLSPPLPTPRVIRATPANFSVWGPKIWSAKVSDVLAL